MMRFTSICQLLVITSSLKSEDRMPDIACYSRYAGADEVSDILGMPDQFNSREDDGNQRNADDPNKH